MSSNQSRISGAVRVIVNLLCVGFIALLVIVDHYDWIVGPGLRRSIPNIILFMLILIVWSWKDYLDIYKLGLSGFEAQNLPDAKSNEAKPMELPLDLKEKDKEALEKFETLIEQRIFDIYKNTEGTISIEIAARDLGIPRQYVENILDSLCKSGKAISTRLPKINSTEKYYILNCNNININVEKAIENLKINEIIYNDYRLFNLELIPIDALVIASKFIYVIIIHRNETKDVLIDIAKQKRSLIVENFNPKPKQHIKACIVLTKNSDFKIEDTNDQIVFQV